MTMSYLTEETEEFIGRDQEIKLFSSWLEDSSAHRILFFHDAEDQERKGGIGKTRLLKRLIALVNERYKNFIPVPIDFFNITERNAIIVAERVVRGLQARFPDWSARSFEQLRETQKRNDRESLVDAFIADLRALEERMAETNSHLLLFFDTFEVIEHNPVIAVLDPSHTFPDNYQMSRIRAVIAGRNAPVWSHQNWVKRQHEVKPEPLSPFTPEEMRQYVALNADIDVDEMSTEILKKIYEKTEGRPILIGLVVDFLNRKVMSLEKLLDVPTSQFEEYLVGQINQLDSPQKRAILIMAHIYHRFNAELLDMIMQKPGLLSNGSQMSYQELAAQLPSLSFIRHANQGADFVLHDEMRRLVNKYCWAEQDTDKRGRVELSHLAVQYYDAQIAQAEDDELRQGYIVEALSHLLFEDVNNGFASFEQHFERAINLSLRSFARSLLEEARKFEEFLSPDQRRDFTLAEAKLLQEEGDAGAALKLYQSLESDTQWIGQHRAELLYEEGNCYQQEGQWDEAIASFKACLDLERSKEQQSRYAEVLRLLGYMYRLKGQYDEAMRYYEDSLAALKKLDNMREYATVLRHLGNLYRLQGRLEEGERSCKLGLTIHRNLFAKGQASELDVGLSFSTLGHVYKDQGDLATAEHYYQSALEIYNHIGDKYGIAGAFNSLGQTMMAKGNLDKAEEYFEQAYRVAADIDRESCLVSLNSHGRVLTMRDKWEEAITYFKQGLAVAQQKDAKHEAENLFDLARAYDHLDLPIGQALKDAKRISSKYKYYNILGLAEELQGSMYFKQGEYRSAFKHFRAAGRYMALYNSLQFEKFRRRLVDILIETPDSFRAGALDALLEYWYDLHLDKPYPELLDVCKEVRKHMIL